MRGRMCAEGGRAAVRMAGGWLCGLVVVALVPARMDAQATPPRPPATKVVRVGVHLNQITGFSLRDNSYNVEAYVWFRWDPKQWPETVGSTGTKRALPYETFEVIGGRDVSYEMNGQSPGLAVIRLRATISRRLDISDFPLDNHVVALAFEDIEKLPEVRFLADSGSSAIGPDVFVNGWTLDRLRTGTSETVYRSSFGDMYMDTRAATIYSRVTFEVPLRRDGPGIFWKTFIGLFIAVAVSLLTFRLPVTYVDPRFGLSVGALFAAVGNQWIIASELPASTVWTLSDKMHAMGYLSILLALVESTVALHLARGTDAAQTRGRRLDAVSGGALGVVWVGTVVVLAVRAY